MKRIMKFNLILVILLICLIACGGGGGGAGGGDKGGGGGEPAVYNASGKWELTLYDEIKLDGNFIECVAEEHTTPDTINILQVSNNVAIKDQDGFVAEGEIDGSNYSFSYRKEDYLYKDDYSDVIINFTMNSDSTCTGTYVYNEITVFPEGEIFFCKVKGKLTGILVEKLEIDPDFNSPPVATILNPVEGITFYEDENIQFKGSWEDSRDFYIPDTSIVWTSDNDGFIGSGETCSIEGLSEGIHQITLTVTDYDGAEGSATLMIPINKKETYNDGVIPDTGQITSHTDLFGEDSDYTIHPPHYTKLNKNGLELDQSAGSWAMVRDDVLGLIWEVKTDNGDIHDKDNSYSMNDAQTIFIAQLNSDKFGGYTDWRLPTIFELTILVHPDAFRPAGNIAYFPHTKWYWWSATPYGGLFEGRWYIDMYSGETEVYSELTHGSMIYNKVRAVRGKKHVGTFVDNGDATVSDVVTGLMWQQADGGKMSCRSAIEYCEELNLNGFSDWRLPNRNELVSIVSYERIEPSIDIDYFPSTQSSNPSIQLSNYMTSTFARSGAGHWSIDFYSGNVIHYSSSGFVRCVRNDF